MLLITDDNQDFSAGNKAFLDFASANKKEVLRFAYVYQHHQQPLCQALLHNQAVLSPQVSERSTFTLNKCTEQKDCQNLACERDVSYLSSEVLFKPTNRW